MKKISLILSFISAELFIVSQVVCPAYTTIGSATAVYAVSLDPACVICSAGVSTVWTGATCAGYLVSTVNGPPVTSLTLAYGSVNFDDYATITIDGGGVMSIEGTHVGVDGDTIGPYTCNGDYGDVFITITSTAPFSTVTLVNSGCSSGWIIQCPGDISYAGADTLIKACEGEFILSDYLIGADAGGTWTEITSSGQFNSSTATLTTTGLAFNTFEFQYTATTCGPIDQASIIVKYGVDTVCTEAITPPIPDTTNTGTTTAFSPNNDGKNDYWVINDLNNQFENTVTIYNRWGDAIRIISNYDNTTNVWDGNMSNNISAEAGTYFYAIEFKNGEKKSGWIQLVR